ncbi:MAG: hypothetical protein U0V02_17915 [Anaerolineales bacterium]
MKEFHLRLPFLSVVEILPKVYIFHPKTESEASHDLPYISMQPASTPMTPVMGYWGER